MMGITDSPYHTCQVVSIAREVKPGNRKIKFNPLYWSDVALNLPGYAGYQPRLHWASKRREEGCVLADLFI